MGDQVVTPIGFTSGTFCTALARAKLRVRRWFVRDQPREGPADLTYLSDWILRDIGMTREREMGAGPDVDPREAARQFWRS
jgi:hypothetical protein